MYVYPFVAIATLVQLIQLATFVESKWDIGVIKLVSYYNLLLLWDKMHRGAPTR